MRIREGCAQVASTPTADSFCSLLVFRNLTRNGPRPLLAYWCEPQEVRTSGESPINDLLDFWPLGRRLGAGRSYSAKPLP
jgi:hypothetical protein